MSYTYLFIYKQEQVFYGQTLETMNTWNTAVFEMFAVSTSNFCSPWNDPRICILLKEVMEVLCKLTRETKAIFGLCSTHVSKLIYGTDINNLRENYKQDRLFQTRSKLQSQNLS